MLLEHTKHRLLATWSGEWIDDVFRVESSVNDEAEPFDSPRVSLRAERDVRDVRVWRDRRIPRLRPRHNHCCN